MKAILCFISLFLTQQIVCENEEDMFLGEEYFAGYIPLSDGEQMFYWLFKARNENPKAPLVLWLQGGPGCSGDISVFYELGPFRINEDLTLRKNPYSWNVIADILFVDQPLGVSFSYVSSAERIPKTQEELAPDFYDFYLNFLEAYPEYKTRDLYITGQSLENMFPQSRITSCPKTTQTSK
jgi:cathepsin A (carboxypeptidase C)